jgi:D-alanyl-D-alanine carboxypeptidase
VVPVEKRVVPVVVKDPMQQVNLVNTNNQNMHWAKYYCGPNSFTEANADITNPFNYSCYNDYVKNMMKYFNLDNPAPFVSARSWVMVNMDNGEVLFAKEEKVQRQVASLTKIVTCSVVYDLVHKYEIDMQSTKVKILSSSTTEKLGGTSAELLAGDLVSIQDLMLGMMLPSGNDAA